MPWPQDLIFLLPLWALVLFLASFIYFVSFVVAMIRRARKLTTASLGVTAVFLFGFGMLCNAAVPGEPTETQMAEVFRAHRAEFEQIKALANQQPRILDVSETEKLVDVETRPGQVDVQRPDDPRPAAIRVLMRSAGVWFFGSRDKSPDFVLWTGNDWSHWGPNQNARGLIYANRRPRPILPSIDDAPRPPGPNGVRVYKRLSGNWYLWFEFE